MSKKFGPINSPVQDVVMKKKGPEGTEDSTKVDSDLEGLPLVFGVQIADEQQGLSDDWAK